MRIHGSLGAPNILKFDFHFIRERVVRQQLDVWFISSANQVVDGFAKSLSTAKLDMFRGNLNLIKL
jgi:hypothetical protein